MEAEQNRDQELAARLKRLDAAAHEPLGFGYDALLERHSAREARARTRTRIVRGTASTLFIAFVGLGVWRFESAGTRSIEAQTPAGEPVEERAVAQPRIVRADTFLAVAALEDHLASVDDAITVARLESPSGAEVARLERTRAELLDSYERVRYAQMVSANF